MPTTPDELLIATRELFPTLETLFINEHPVTKMLYDKQKRQEVSGPYAAFDVIVDGPGDGMQVETGLEVQTATKRNIVRQGSVYVPTYEYTYMVTGPSLRKSAGKNGIIDLLKMYPEAAMQHFRQELGVQFTVGRTTGLTNAGCFLHLNGDLTWQATSAVAAQNGVLEFAAPGSQTSTFLGLPRQGAATNPTPKWANQYGAITNFGAHGRARLRRVYNECQMRAGSYGAPRLMFSDSASFENYYNDLDEQVRYAAEFKGETGGTKLSGLKFHNADWFVDPAFDDDATAFGHSTDGTVYMINPDTFKCLTSPDINSGEIKTGNSYFGLRGPWKQQGQDAWTFDIMFSGQPVCMYLAANGCLEGAAL